VVIFKREYKRHKEQVKTVIGRADGKRNTFETLVYTGEKY
jgi:hypothetical protein